MLAVQFLKKQRMKGKQIELKINISKIQTSITYSSYCLFYN